MLVLFLGPAYGFDPAAEVPAHRAADPGRRRRCGSRTRSRWARSAAGTGPSSRRCCCWSRRSLIAIVLEPGRLVRHAARRLAARRRRRRQLRLLDDQHQRLLPGAAQGLGARASTPAAATSACRSSSSSACWCWPPSGVEPPAGAGRDLHPADRRSRRSARRCSWTTSPRTRNAKGAIREVTRHRETWIISLLYIGTFGSFIGFGFAFGQVLLVQFPEQFPVPVKAAALTFLGPLLGSLVRPVGGGLADRFTGLGGHLLQLRRHGGRRGDRAARLAANSLPVFMPAS